jgi:hypothetical protein
VPGGWLQQSDNLSASTAGRMGVVWNCIGAQVKGMFYAGTTS